MYTLGFFFCGVNQGLQSRDVTGAVGELKVLDSSTIKQQPKQQNAIGISLKDVAIGAYSRLRDELQKSVGDSIVIKLVQFRNWGLTEEAVVFAAHPKTKQDIVKLIAAAREHKVRVRSVGAMHSWSKIHADEDFLVLYMDQLQGEYPGGAKIRISHQGPDQADVMAGVTTGDFMEFQLKEDLYLPANVILQVVTIVGVVAVGCHGVGRNAITPGDYITRMRIFDSDGILRVYTGDDKDMMLAISANFGTFGIIYDVTIQLQPPRNVTVLNKYVPFKSLVNDAAAFKKIVEENWSVELFWFPYNSCPKLSIFGFKCDYDPMADELFLRLINDDTTDAPVVGPWYYTSQEWKDWAAHTALKAASSIYRDFPMETPGLAAVGFNVLKYQYPPNETIKQPLPHAIHYRKYTHLSPVRDIEFAFDLQNNYTKVISVIQTVVDVMLAYNKQGKYPLNIALEMRWMAYGSSYLTPSIIGNPAHGGSGHVFYIEVLSVVDTPHWEEFCKEVASKWMEMDGMPHLAKEWQYIPGIHEHIYKKVSKHVEMFKALLQKSGADPNGIFLNKSLRQLLNM